MAALNEIGSAMLRVDETYNETKEQTKKRIKQYENIQHVRTPFQIGSVTHFGVPSKGGLTVEDTGCDGTGRDDSDGLSGNADSQIQNLPEPYLIPAYVKNSREAFISKNAAGKMKLVELYQYSGFSDEQPNYFPNDVTTLSILMKVIRAQPRAYNETYRQEFDQLFLSEESRAVFQDMFWWVFLNNWAPNSDCQGKLLSRAARSFASLRMSAEASVHRDRFLMDYPMLVSQAVYAAFCATFIDSFPQFGEQFKENVIRIVHEWLTGVRPAARLWTKWNFARLEPEEITARRKILETSERRKSSLAETALIHWPSDDHDLTSIPGLSSRRASKQSRSIQPRSTTAMADGDVKTVGFVSPTMVTQQSINIANKLNHEEHRRKSSTTKASPGIVSEHHESHSLGKGPTYMRTAFNINGRSPAAVHHLTSINVHSNAGLNVLVSRTEIENLPPLDAETYRDVIQHSYKTIRQIDQRYKKFYKQTMRAGVDYSRKLVREQNNYKQKEEALLKKPQEVHTLSELLNRKHKRGGFELTRATQQAVDSALANA